MVTPALAQIQSPIEAKNLRDYAGQRRELFKLLGKSLEECNELAEIYLLAHWRFGEMVKDIPRGRPEKTVIENGFPGTEQQRKTARRFCEAVKESDIPEYVREATIELEQASIAGCLEWLNPGRHGNLKGEYEWYTPREIIEAAREVMGGIDLDPWRRQDREQE